MTSCNYILEIYIDNIQFVDGDNLGNSKIFLSHGIKVGIDCGNKAAFANATMNDRV